MKETDLNYAKDMANMLLSLDVEETEFEAFLIHPFLTQRFMLINRNDEDLTDILKDDNIKLAREKFANLIAESQDIWHIYCYMHKPYRALYFKLIYDHLSEKDYNTFLKNVWIDSENPNQDPNVKINAWINFYKKSNKNLIMSESELEVYNNLPDDELITIYRGVGPGREPFGLSWTKNIKTAKWFANRWNNKNPYIIKAQCFKKDIFAYFNERSEDELVVNVKKIINIERIQL